MDANQFTMRISNRVAEIIDSEGRLCGTVRCASDASLRNLVKCWSGRRCFSTEQDEKAWYVAEKAALAASRTRLLSNALGAAKR